MIAPETKPACIVISVGLVMSAYAAGMLTVVFALWWGAL